MFLVGTEFFGNSGGVQSINRSLARVFSGWSGIGSVELFSLRDAGPSQIPGSVWHPCTNSRAELIRSLGWRLVAQPDLILFTHVRLLPLARMARIFSRRTRIAVLCHGAEVWRPLPQRLHRELQRADFVISPSEFTRASLLNLHQLDPSRVCVIPHGLEPGWCVAPGSNHSSETPKLLTVCRMSRDDARYGTKGLDALLEAMTLLRETIPGLQLSIVGDGDDRNRLEAKSRDLGLQSSVHFHGAVDAASLHQQYRNATLFVLPSNLEGFGVVFLEAMANGLPVVARHAAAAPEVVQHGKTGLLVTDASVAALVDAISTLLHDCALRRSMSMAAHKRVSEYFRFEQFSARWLDWLGRAVPEQTYMVRHTLSFPSFFGSDI